PRRIDWRDSSPVTICFAIFLSSSNRFQISDFEFQIALRRPAARDGKNFNPSADPSSAFGGLGMTATAKP
ncbi:MAG: hypothetical protein ACRD5G_07905, partial [Candidatus Acidiferrales bacterium]